MKTFLTLLVLTLHANTTYAQEFTSRNSADVGFTSNANLTSENTESDMFYKLGTANTFKNSKHSYGVRLGFIDYISESENDALSLRLTDSWKGARDLTYRLGIVGNYYPSGGAGTTESAFNNFGADFGVSKEWEKGSKLFGDWGGGYRLRYYPSFSGRNDHNGYVNGSLDYELNSRTSLGAYSEAGLLFSSLGEYSRMYLDLSGSVDYKLGRRWNWESELLLAQSFFIDRTVTTQTEVTNKRGRVTSGSVDANEKYTLISVTSQLMRAQTQAFNWGGALGVVNQSSKSGLQDYSAFEAVAKLNFVF